MVSASRVLILVLCVVALAAPVCAQQASSPLPFIGLTPCRIADTRNPVGPFGGPALTGGVPRSFPLIFQCGVPSSAQAVSLNVTVTNTQGPGFLLIFPFSGTQPSVSTLNYVAGQTVANAAIVPLGPMGLITVIAGVSGFDLIIDVNGYYGNPTADSSNVFLGSSAGNTTMTGIENTAIGTNTLFSNTTGSSNTASGDSALQSNTEGNSNTASGSLALSSNTLGSNNTASGAAALLGNTGGSNNTASGTFALANNTTGFDNTASGALALENNTTGIANTASGELALLSNTTGSENIAIGFDAGLNLTTGGNNIDIGNIGVAGESSTIRIGVQGSHTDSYIGGIFGSPTAGGFPVFVNSVGKLGTNFSARRFKQDIREIGEASDGLMRLRPVTFRYKPELDPKGLTQYGLIAEEVAEVYPELVAYDPDGKALTVHYHLVNALLLNEVQRDRKTIADLTARLERLEALMSESIR